MAKISSVMKKLAIGTHQNSCALYEFQMKNDNLLFGETACQGQGHVAERGKMLFRSQY